jgi:hypothetical protein
MSRPTTFALSVFAALSIAVAAPSGKAIAQEKQHLSYKIPASDSKMERQLNVDVGDQPNHIVRVYDTRSTFANNAPMINGLKLKEQWARGTVDIIDGSGSGVQYGVYLMDNGDKFFAHTTNILQNVSGKVTITGVGNITGGTGKFAGVQGVVRQATNIDFKASSVDSTYDIDYSIGK